MIMRKLIYMTACAVAMFASCNKIDMSDIKSNVLDINVRNGAATKAVVEGTTLPTGSEIGLFVTDDNGIAYDGNYLANVKYTATGEGETQKWNTETDIMLSAKTATINAYYPYDESIVDITSIPIEVTSAVQKDWMWGTPVSGLNNKNSSATISMNHALAAVRLNLVKGNFVGTGNVDYVSIKSNAAATSAIMNAKNGSLTNKKGNNTLFENNEEFIISEEGKIIDFIVVPTGSESTIYISMIINGEEMKATTSAVTLESGKLYEYVVSVGVDALQLNNLNVTEWIDGEVLEELMSPNVPTVNITGTTTDIRFEQTYANKTLTLKAIPPHKGYNINEVTVSGGKSTQSVDENGVRTIVITDIVSDVKVTFAGTTYVPWARIQHVDGTLYTAEEWLAAEAAGTVTDADANGVAIKYSKKVLCPHIISPSESSFKWSDKSMGIINDIPYIRSTSDGASLTNGKSYTDAILAAVANGTLPNAPAAQYCTETVFANGQHGYLPSVGEIWAWSDNLTEINICLEAIASNTISSTYWTSNTYNNQSYHKPTVFIFNGHNKGPQSYSADVSQCTRAACALSLE